MLMRLRRCRRDVASDVCVVADVNDAPVPGAPFALTVAENLPVGALIGTLGYTDQDPLDTVSLAAAAAVASTALVERPLCVVSPLMCQVTWALVSQSPSNGGSPAVSVASATGDVLYVHSIACGESWKVCRTSRTDGVASTQRGIVPELRVITAVLQRHCSRHRFGIHWPISEHLVRGDGCRGGHKRHSR
jgi:hypothetical protein